VAIWNRLVSLEHLPVLLNTLSDDRVQKLQHRLGRMALFHPLLPDNEYCLDLSVPEDKELAKWLHQLGKADPGAFVAEVYQESSEDKGKPEDIRALKLWPKPRNIPEHGVWSFCYIAGAVQGGAGIDWDNRREIAQKAKGWALEDGEQFQNLCGILCDALVARVEAPEANHWKDMHCAQVDLEWQKLEAERALAEAQAQAEAATNDAKGAVLED